MKKDPISDALGMNEMTSLPPVTHTVQVLDHEEIDHAAQFEEVKTNLRQIISKSGPALNNLIDVAMNSESDKMYLALAALMKSMTEANRELADTTVKQREMTGPKEPTTINNNLNITATDLLKMLKGTKNEE